MFEIQKKGPGISFPAFLRSSPHALLVTETSILVIRIFRKLHDPRSQMHSHELSITSLYELKVGLTVVCFGQR